MIWLIIIPLAVLAIAIWRPVYGLAAVVLLWPSYLLRGEIAGIPTTVLELSIYAVATTLIIRLLLKKISWQWPRITTTAWILISLWIVAWVIATFTAADREAALGAFKAWLVDPLIFAALAAIIIKHENDRRIIFNAALLSGAIVALAGLVQLVGWRSTLQEGRLSSFFHPVANYAAMYLGPLIAVGLSYLLHRQKKSKFIWSTVVIMSVALIFTLSYGGYLAVAAAGLFTWLWLPASRLKNRLLIIALGVLAAGTFILTQLPNFKQHFNTADRSSGLVRTEIWVTSWALIQQHPLVGIGPNNFEPAYRDEVPKHYWPPLEWLVAQPHNLYLALWLETGLLGLMTFIAMAVYFFRSVWRRLKTEPDQRAIYITAMTGVMAAVVHGLVDTPYFKNDLALIFVFLLLLPWLGRPHGADI